MILVAHGIEFFREGYCRQCGGCCGECPHHYQAGGFYWCDVYHTREEYCEECKQDHADCLAYPDNPWIHQVRRGACGYRFERADGGSMDELPFLNGEPYLTK